MSGASWTTALAFKVLSSTLKARLTRSNRVGRIILVVSRFMMDYFVIKRSRALKNFKELIGQNNHFLITILVGLDGISKNQVEIDPEFSTSWNPKSKNDSVSRSRLFAIKATLSWCIDALDAYFTLANRNPKLIQDEDFRQSLSKAGNFVSMKFDAFKKHLDNCALVEAALVELALKWRNRLVHHFADNDVTSKCRRTLIENKDYIKSTFRGLEVDLLLCNFDKKGEVPKFKEITSFIQATILFISAVDEILINKLNLEQYCHEVIKNHLSDCEDSKERIRRLDNIWSKDFETKKRILISILCNNGFILVPETRLNCVSDELIIKYANMNVRLAKKYFLETTNITVS